MSTLDNPIFKVLPLKGVNLVEQQSPLRLTTVDGAGATTSERAHSHLNEPSWNLADMLGRFNYVTSVEWTTTQPQFTTLYTADVISDLLQQEISAIPFTRFTYWRANNVTIHLQLTASRFHQGRLICGFVPSQRSRAASSIVPPPLTRLMGLNHAFLDPANGSVVELKIPFDYFRGYLDLINNDSLGQFYIGVFNQLNAGTGSSTAVEVKVFFSIEGSEFKIPRPGGSSFATLVRREAGAIGPFVKSLVEPVNFIGDVLTSFGLDKPVTAENPAPLIRKDQQYFNQAQNIENLDKLALYPKEQQMVDREHFATKQDEMSIKYLSSKPHYVTTINWASTDAVGTVKWSGLVGPLDYNVWKAAAAVGSPVNATSLDFVSKFFTFWRGGIRFIFDIVTSQFHEGRLDVVFSPTKMTLPSTYASSLSQYATSFTVRNSSNSFEVIVPFLSDTPWKRVCNGGAMSDTFNDAVSRFTDYFLGSIGLQVSVPLKNPANIISNVDINVFVCAADDFELSYPSVINNSLLAIPDTTPSFSLVRKEGGGGTFMGAIPDLIEDKELPEYALAKLEAPALAGEQAEAPIVDKKSTPPKVQTTFEKRITHTEKAGTVLGFARAKTFDPKVHHFGEHYTTLRDICKRYQPFLISSFPITAETFLNQTTDPARAYIVSQTVNFSELSNLNYPGFISTMGNMYRNYRGPMNFKIKAYITQTPTAALANVLPPIIPKIEGYVSWIPVPNLLPLVTPATLSDQFGDTFDFGTYSPNNNLFLGHFTTDTVAEFQIPFLHHTSSALMFTQNETVGRYDSDSGSFQGTLVIGIRSANWPFTTLANSNFRLVIEYWFAFGDESHFGTFMGIPKMGFAYTDGDGPTTVGTSIYPDAWYLPPPP